MKYPRTVAAEFVRRRNRFTADVLLNGDLVPVHVKNTGRLGEILVPGAEVRLTPGMNPERKTAWDLVSAVRVYGDGRRVMINIDSQAPNTAAAEWLEKIQPLGKGAVIEREVTVGDSRLDLNVTDGTRSILVEVKGCTLDADGIALFPDAPTERGVKHLNELARCAREGREAWILFVIQLEGLRELRPNAERDPAFARALCEAADAGVRVCAVECRITEDGMEPVREVPVRP